MANYEYKIGKRGPWKNVIVYKDGSIIWTGEASSSASEEILIEEAEINLKDSEPGVVGMKPYGTKEEEDKKKEEEEEARKAEEEAARKAKEDADAAEKREEESPKFK